jgi:LysR family transcriptional activator of nhaA
MEWLNYHHLFYFWLVAREGSIARACKELRLAHPTVSAQLHKLEVELGQRLFVRRGRHLVLTDAGRIALGFAEDIFSLGRDLVGTMKGRVSERPVRLIVGLPDVVPKSVVHAVTEPVFRIHPDVRILFREDKSADEFLAELVTYRIDVILADGPLLAEGPVHVFNHLLGKTTTTLLAAPGLARKFRRRFPRSLDGAPFVLPGSGSQLRRDLERWLQTHGLVVRTVAEADDTSLAEVLAEAGLGIVAVPSSIEAEVLHRYGLQVVGRIDEVSQSFYAVSAERKIRNPAVVTIVETARDIFKRD